MFLDPRCAAKAPRPRRAAGGGTVGSTVVDLDAVRTFVAAADAGRLQEAADDLSIARRAYMAVSDVDQDGRTDVLFWKGMGVGIAFNRGCVP